MRLATLLLTLVSFAVRAQFVQIPEGNNEPQSIYFLNQQVGFLGGLTIERTTDGGHTWIPNSFSSPDSTLFQFLSDYHFYFFDALHGVAVASSLPSLSGVVIKTDDGGKKWKAVFVDSSFPGVPFLGFKDVHFFDANHGFAVGGGGRRIITSDGGNTWTRNDLPVAADFWDIFFVDSNIGFISGKGHVLKTTNGGQTWQDQIVGQNGDIIKSIYFTDAQTGHAVSNNGYIFKSSDGGATWSTYFVSFYQLNRITFTDQSTGYIAGAALENHNVLRTTNGGESWEQTEQVFPCTLYDISFLNANTIMTCGTNFFGGVSYYGMTSAGVGPTIPQAFFNYTLPASTCPGFTVDFSNKGDPAYTNSWYVNDHLESTSYNFQYAFNNSGSYSIRLTTSNDHGGSSSYYGAVNVSYPETLPPFSLYYQDHICGGADWAVQVFNSHGYYSSAQIELWANGAKLDVTRNFDYLYPINKLMDTTVFTLKIFANLNCVGMVEKDTSFVVTVTPPDYKPEVEASGLAFCPGVPFFFTVHHSNPNLHYYYSGELGDFSNGISGNGGDLVIPVNTYQSYYGGNYVVHATETLCPSTGQPFYLVRSPIKAEFGVNDIALFQDELLVTTDASTGTVYSWNFGATGQPQSSNQSSPPNVVFTTPGLKQISLHLEDQYHCKDSKDTLVFIAEHVAGDPVISCGETAIEFTHLEKVVDSKSDSFGNIYTAGMYPGPDIPPQFLSIDNVFIEKIDAGGNRLWRKDVTATLNDEYNHFYGPTIFGIAVDGAGNVYAGINFDDTEAVISGVTFKDYHYGNVGKSVLCKFSPTGEFLWHIFIFDDLTNQDRGNRMNTFITAITLDRRGDILFDLEGFTSTTAMQLPNGDKVYGSNTYGGFAIVKVDQEGNYINHAPYTAQVSLTQPVVDWTLDRGKLLVTPKLFADEANNVIFSGFYYYSEAAFGNSVLPQNETGYQQRIFNAILKDGEWTSAFGGSQLTISYASTLNTAILASDTDQAVYVSGRLESPAPFFLVNGDTIDANKVNGYLIKWKYNGSIDWIKYTNNVSFQSFKKNPVTGIIQAVGTIDHFGVFDANSAHPKGIRSNGKHDPFTINFDNTGNTVSGVAIGTAADEYSNFLLESGCGQIAYVSLQEDAVVIRKSSTTGSCGQIPPPLSVQSNLVSICKGFETQLAATGADAYKWEPAVGLSNNTIGNPLASPSKTTVYTVTGYSDINCLAQKQVRIVVQDSIPVFTYTRKNLLVHFRTDSQPGDTFSWDFGDGGQGNSNEVAHTYLRTGIYSICLTTNNQCGIQTTCQDVAVDCSAPIPSILLGSVGDNYACQFLDVNDPELTLHWDFGDGGTSDERSPLHVFHSEGPFNVCLTATNNCMDSTYCTVLELGCLSFVADFTAETNHIDGVHFVNKSINAYLWEWDFGDGSTSLEENPVHAYAVAGSYDVCLRAGNKCGYSNPFCKQVTAAGAVTTGVTNGPEDISIFPNPFHSQFSILVPRPKDIEEIEIINNLGQVVHRITGVNSLNQINLAHCSAGLYHIRIWFRNEIISRSIIKLD